MSAPDPLDNGPVVAHRARRASPYFIIGSVVILAVALFLVLNNRRVDQTASLGPTETTVPAEIAPPPLAIPTRALPAAPSPPAVVMAPPVAAPPPVALPVNDQSQRLHAPAVVVDLQSAGGAARVVPVAASAAAASPLLANGPGAVSGAGLPAQSGSTTAAAEAGSALLATGAGSVPSGLGAHEQFAARVSGSLPEPAVATQLTGLGTTITQGAIIPGVLETALNSDLPGYTRAVVSRDVRSFDGKAVLIPRGSRLIGQYRSALSLGQSRLFIIWTRVIRPDGVSIQIGSPGGDALGRGGLTGEVNTHFFARFGSSILLSVLNGGVAALAGTPSTQISIGSPAAAAGTAATAIVPSGTDIMPTVDVKQGEAINIFVARDLDFSAVKPVL